MSIKGRRLLCTHSSWVLGPGCRGGPPELAVPLGRSSPRGCQPGGCQSTASACIKGGDLVPLGIFPCRAANSVTRDEVSLPPRAARCLFPGSGADKHPTAHPLAPTGQAGWWAPSSPRQALPVGRGMLAGREAPLEAQPQHGCSSVTQSTSSRQRWLYIARRDVCAGNTTATGQGVRLRLTRSPTAARVPMGKHGVPGAAQIAPLPMRPWLSCKAQALGLGMHLSSACCPRGSHPAPCPSRQDLSLLGGASAGG